ncbi:MAG: ATP-binding protein [Candidatus Aureabacteria bacterium]|nr:ATP-binding protein [Candidatus Auribacterota bacterium]
MRGQMTLVLKNDIAEVGRLAGAVESFGRGHRLSGGVVHDARLALEEAVVNIIRHGHGAGRARRITVHMSVQRSELVLEVSDSGRPFNPLDLPPPDLNIPVEQRRTGGLGVYLVRKVMDSASYTRVKETNVLTMKKRIE